MKNGPLTPGQGLARVEYLLREPFVAEDLPDLQRVEVLAIKPRRQAEHDAPLRVHDHLIERAGKMPRGSFKGLADSLAVDMSGAPTPIRAILGRPPRSYRQAVKRALG